MTVLHKITHTIASAVGTVSGFGVSTLMVPVMLFFLPYPETLLFVGLVHWFSDVIAGFALGLFWMTLLMLVFKAAMPLSKKLAKKLEIKNSLFFADMRMVITGKKISPPLNESMEILGKDECLTRLALIK